MTQLLILLGINVALGFVASGIAWDAHLGGLLVGAAIGWVYRRTRRPVQRRAQTLAVVGIIVRLLLVFVFVVASAPAF
ncbi:MAG: rhomboid family intramembrane serine protease [Pseudolysinimonas sp.]|uniref:rhomboid family intramembrane serine protease n=1 Tax=Pseudolysinimonas sp. TaxID=2680009 RepID=UPI003C788E70